MAYVFRAATTQGNASGGALTVTAPAGLTNGDLIEVVAYLETGTNTWSSVGAGFTAKRLDANGTEFGIQVWWKIASSEPSSWTWTPSTSGQWRTVDAAAYSGATGTGGDQVELDGTAAIVTAAIQVVAPSITTSTDNDLVVCAQGNFAGAAASSVTGFATNKRADFGGVSISDADKTPAGATGTTTIGGGGTSDYIARQTAFLLSAAGGSPQITPPLLLVPTSVRVLR